MPHVRVKTTNNRSYCERRLRNAVDCVLKGEISIRKCAEKFQIPKNTLAWDVNKVKNAEGNESEVNFCPNNEHLMVFAKELSLQDYI